MKKISRIIALLIIASMIFTGCSSEKIKTNVIEDENDVIDIANKDNDNVNNKKDTNKEVKVDSSLSSVNKIYEIYNSDKDSNTEKIALGWLDDEYVINIVNPIDEYGSLKGIKSKNDILKPFGYDIIGSSNEKTNLRSYLEKHNYKTGESEKIYNFKNSAECTLHHGSNNGNKILIKEFDEVIDVQKFNWDNKLWYKKLNEKGKVYIYDLKTKERNLISEIDVYVHGGLIEWSYNDRYAVFFKDIIKNDDKLEVTYKLGIYDTVESKLIEYNYNKTYKSKYYYNQIPIIQVTDKGKIFFGNHYGYKEWGYINSNKLFEINTIVNNQNKKMSFRNIVKDIDDKRIILINDSLYDYNLQNNKTNNLTPDIDLMTLHYDISEDGKFIIAEGSSSGRGIYKFELDNDKVVNIKLLYKLTENMHIMSMGLSSDNKKIVLLVSENKEKIKELVIELK